MWYSLWTSRVAVCCVFVAVLEVLVASRTIDKGKERVEMRGDGHERIRAESIQLKGTRMATAREGHIRRLRQHRSTRQPQITESIQKREGTWVEKAQPPMYGENRKDENRQQTQEQRHKSRGRDLSVCYLVWATCVAICRAFVEVLEVFITSGTIDKGKERMEMGRDRHERLRVTTAQLTSTRMATAREGHVR